MHELKCCELCLENNEYFWVDRYFDYTHTHTHTHTHFRTFLFLFSVYLVNMQCNYYYYFFFFHSSLLFWYQLYSL